MLFESVSRLGNRGDIVDVSDGYARNYLIPKGIASKATAGAEEQAKGMKKAWQQRNAQEREAAEEMAQTLVSKPFELTAKAGKEGKLFGSVTSADIANAVTEQSGITIDRKMVNLEDSIRSLGDYAINLQLHSEVEVPIRITVVES